MATAGLPNFAYHPDPLATGSIRADNTTVCCCCGITRGYVYTGPVYTAQEIAGLVCPWCIADGSAARRFGAFFADSWGLDGVAQDVVDVVCQRTPGFSSWQDPHWLHHCGDAAQYLGHAGIDDLRRHPEALDRVRAGLSHLPETGRDAFVGYISRDGPLNAHLFRCRVCGEHLAYTDSD